MQWGQRAGFLFRRYKVKKWSNGFIPIPSHELIQPEYVLGISGVSAFVYLCTPMIPGSGKTVTNLFISSFVSWLYLNRLYIAFFVCFFSSAYALVASMKCAIVVSSKYNSNREMADVSVLGKRWGPGIWLGLNISPLVNWSSTTEMSMTARGSWSLEVNVDKALEI